MACTSARRRGAGGVNGTVPHDALMQALAQKELMAMVDDLGAPVQWTWLGPGNIGGRLRAILIDPGNPQHMWVGSAGGGVWYSDTGGASWVPRNNLITMLGCGCMALDPSNSNHLYFGSGEATFDAVAGSSNTAILRGAGLFESTDAGVTWTRILATSTPDWYFIGRLALAPGNPLVMLAATGSGIWRSTDGGQTWSQRTTTRTLDVDFHPTNALLACRRPHRRLRVAFGRRRRDLDERADQRGRHARRARIRAQQSDHRVRDGQRHGAGDPCVAFARRWRDVGAAQHVVDRDLLALQQRAVGRSHERKQPRLRRRAALSQHRRGCDAHAVHHGFASRTTT
jgi:hypothetical protein